MRIELFYMLNLENISKAEKTYLNNNLNSVSTIPKEAYVSKGTIVLNNVKYNKILNKSFKTKFMKKIQNDNKLKTLKKGDVIVNKYNNQPYILTDYNFKPVSWTQIK